ncbi:hypothetical protein Vadar_029624 [Vaccinium darrowii]|uniref:Uncharacterized protein n=1 Tax=Vaccinium darrowii TaxID=229202 RepID=A0ACB7ZFW0_9ERIC|nr:hypothetical protein Vadar_029624 [Vaccinium darrowii]
MEKEIRGSLPTVKTLTVKPEKLEHSIISRSGFGTAGRPIPLVVNHFKASIKNPDKSLYQYTVSITREDSKAVLIKGLKRKVVNKLYQIYFSELAGRRYAYDGEQSLYTVDPLPDHRMEFAVVLEESFAKRSSPDVISSHGGSPSEYSKRSKHSFGPNSFKVEINYAATITLRPISLAIQGSKAEHVHDALRVLDTILRQQASDRHLELSLLFMFLNFFPTPHAKRSILLFLEFMGAGSRGCLLVRQSFFHDDSRNFTNIGGGVTCCRGFYSSFRATHGGLSLNMDVSATMIVTPGPVIDFLLANQDAKEPCDINWAKEAKKMLKNMRVQTRHTNMEFRITGLSEKPCNQQYFSWKLKNDDGGDDGEKTLEITVYEYFAKHHKIQLTDSADMPCLHVGKKKAQYLPLELCTLVSLQRYTKALSPTQRASLLDKSRQEPQECIRVLTNAMRNCRFDSDPLLAACGISIEKQLTQVEGRILEAPMLKAGKVDDFVPHNGRWNYHNKLGGMNSLLAIEPFPGVPVINSLVPQIKNLPTMILGMDVSHGSPGSSTPSIASVVGSLSWPLISRYRAAVRAQPPKVEMIESLFKPVANGGDDGIMRELLMDFYLTSAQHKPAQIILFRDGVSESQFNQVLNYELDDIVKAYKHLGEGDIPKFTVIVAQKNHHTKLFQASGSKNVPPGLFSCSICLFEFVYLI